MNAREVGKAAGLAALIAVAAIGALIAFNRGEETVRIGEWIRSGGVCFRMKEYRRGETDGGIGEGALSSSVGVVLEVRNDFVPLDYRFDPSHAVLVDDTGRSFPPLRKIRVVMRSTDPLLQPAASEEEDPFARELALGASAVGELVYEVPRDAKGLRLRVTMGGKPLGEEVAATLEGRRFIALERVER